MRPRTLAEYAGQKHLLEPGKLLWRAIRSDRLSSIILFGPPGTGKTTLATLISAETKSHFEPLNAVSSNVAEIRKVIDQAKLRARQTGRRTILFIDEIHRFNKAQQDVLMPDVEKGNPILIGATTYNPFFSIVPALISRSLIFELKPLEIKEIESILRSALTDLERGLGAQGVEADEEAIAFLAKVSDGDARRALNALEVAALTTEARGGQVRITLRVAEESIQKKAVVYDGADDSHFDTISAFIKSMRGSDPDAALYYLAKMLYAGEDIRFIARRLVICAAEDVGNADPQALVLAESTARAVDFLGMPEARIPLAQATTYIACAPKSNASYAGIEAAMKDVAEGRLLEVPDHLRDAHYKGAKSLGRGEGYLYAHDHPGNHVEQRYLAEKRAYYEPTSNGYEKQIRERLRGWRQQGDGHAGSP